MTSTPVFNIAFQMAAAFVIFITGFVALFASVVTCAAAGWTLYACTRRLAVLLDRSYIRRRVINVDDQKRFVGESMNEHGQHSENRFQVSA